MIASVIRADLSQLGVAALLFVGVIGCQAEAAPTPTDRPASRAPSEPRLTAPTLEEWQAEVRAELGEPTRAPEEGFDQLAVAELFDVPVFNEYKKPRRIIGRLRRGTALSAKKVSPTAACHDNEEDGVWYRVPDGYICTTSGYVITTDPNVVQAPRPPDVNAANPFLYARVVEPGTPRLSRLPTAQEHKVLQNHDAWHGNPPEPVIEDMHGDFFLSLEGEERVGKAKYYRTIAGEYVQADKLQLRETPAMHGQRLRNGDEDLPLAFVFGPDDEVPMFCRKGKTAQRCGTAEKHARFKPKRRVEIGGTSYAETPDGYLIPLDVIRWIEATQRPSKVGPADKWVHINLGEQWALAYEGDTPVYATLISSGKPGFDTPTGTYQTQRKYISKTMRGPDPDSGIYHVEDVPWTMYYKAAYAVHGAYWHNTFGKSRSHGCTNLAPADARWIFQWSNLELPKRWYARLWPYTDALWFHFTRDEEKSS